MFFFRSRVVATRGLVTNRCISMVKNRSKTTVIARSVGVKFKRAFPVVRANEIRKIQQKTYFFFLFYCGHRPDRILGPACGDVHRSCWHRLSDRLSRYDSFDMVVFDDTAYNARTASSRFQPVVRARGVRVERVSNCPPAGLVVRFEDSLAYKSCST